MYIVASLQLKTPRSILLKFPLSKSNCLQKLFIELLLSCLNSFKISPTILIDLDGVLNNYSGNYDKNFIPEINDFKVWYK